jgi:hypothetical protein
MKIFVNGYQHTVESAFLKYEDVVRLAGKSGDYLTVTYRAPRSMAMDGRDLRAGQYVNVLDGMVFNVSYTGNA